MTAADIVERDKVQVSAPARGEAASFRILPARRPERLAGAALFGFALGAILALARGIADTVLFMKAGRILEAGPPAQVLDAPRHPRTAEFLSKVL